MLIPLHMYMYLKFIDIIVTNFVLVIHVLIVNPVFMAKVQTKLCTLSWHNLQHPLHFTVHSHVLLHEDVVRRKLRVVWLRNKKIIDQ